MHFYVLDVYIPINTSTMDTSCYGIRSSKLESRCKERNRIVWKPASL